MTGNWKRDWRGIGCAAILAASIAFPMGLLVGRDEPARESVAGASRPVPARTEAPPARNFYSPTIAGDPYVIDEQRKVLRALELSCLRLKQHCAEAGQARRLIEQSER
jgi:hypothetical protein